MDDARALAGRLRPEAKMCLDCNVTMTDIDPRDILDLIALAERADRLAAPEGVGLTRWAMGVAHPYTDPSGQWVRHEDAAAAIAAEKARTDALAEDAEYQCSLILETATARNAAEAERDALKAALVEANRVLRLVNSAFHSSQTSEWRAARAAVDAYLVPIFEADRAAFSKTQGGG